MTKFLLIFMAFMLISIVAKSQTQSDSSDAVWSIVMPTPASHDVDMGKVLVNTSKDKVESEFISNIGSWKFRVDSIYFRGADASYFSLVSGFPVYIVDAGLKKTAEFSFAPKQARVYNAEIVIITQADTLYQKIIGEGVEPQLEVFSGILDFGEVEIGNDTTIQDIVLLKNISNSPITITNTLKMSPDIEQFNIISGGGSFILAAKSERKLTLQFKPKYGGRTSGRIGFEYNGVGSPAVAQLFGTGVGGVISIPSDSGYAGDEKNIQLILEKIKPEGIQALASRFSAKMKFQGTIFCPKDITKISSFSNDSIIVKLEGEIPNSNILINLPVTVGLGSVQETDIELYDFIFLDKFGKNIEYEVDYRFGTFKLLGICQEGGTRLLNPNGKIQINAIKPNPADEQIEIELNLLEKTGYKLILINSLGQTVREINRVESSKGTANENIQLAELSAGIYNLILQTESETLNEKLIILR